MPGPWVALEGVRQGGEFSLYLRSRNSSTRFLPLLFAAAIAPATSSSSKMKESVRGIGLLAPDCRGCIFGGVVGGTIIWAEGVL
ncbi:hypothetical protein M413DRAFT_133360 [Hebeloma cylindrosporum]|uniref:Uncharacterized protein n=1 Tax=Hebeloma cylindrosporum TaxID=76867 RepID=A0A0C3CFK0_HEBCY|nr:hypothetical protein M413DRAFT_133360 [Hebeloma cylindrosporum h7]